MNHRYVWYHVFDFVRLQVSDKMPFNIFGQTFVFSCHFLHFAFSKKYAVPPDMLLLSLHWGGILRQQPAGLLEGVRPALAFKFSAILIVAYAFDGSNSGLSFGSAL